MVHHLCGCGVKWKEVLPQLLVRIGAMLLMIQTGCAFVWTSPYLARLSAPDSPIPISMSQGSWIAALLNIGRLFGAVTAAVNTIFLGTRKAVFLTFVPILVGWIALFLANSVVWIFAFRFCFGIAIGMVFVCFPMYIGEVALPSRRGAIVSLSIVASPISGVVTSLLGNFLSLQEFSICYVVPCLLGLAIFGLVLPDSPQHLIKCDKLEAAEESLKWYRGVDNVTHEFEDTKEYMSIAQSMTLKERFKDLKSPYVSKVFFLVIMLYVFMQASGLNTIVFYMEIILRSAKFHLIRPSYVVVIACGMSVVFTIVSMMLIDRCGRRILMVVSSLGVTLAMIGLGTHFLLLSLGYDPEQLQLLPFGCFLFYQSVFSIGFLTVPSTVQSEIMPAHVKSFVSCAATIASGIVGFIVAIMYQPMVGWVGETYVFYLHGLIAFSVTPIVLKFLPETKGKSLNQIQQELMGKSKEVQG